MVAVREIDKLWDTGFDRTELLDLASLALVTLQVGTLDVLEMGDVVGGRTWPSSRLPRRRERCGSPSARRSSRTRSATRERRVGSRKTCRPEQIRPFLLVADDQLKAVAEGPEASPVARPARGQLAPKANVADVVDWLKNHGAPSGGDPAVIAAAFRARDVFDHELRLASTLMMAGWAEAGGKDEKPGPGVLAAFERSLAAREREKGRFFDDAVAAARTRAVFYSGLDLSGASTSTASAPVPRPRGSPTT